MPLSNVRALKITARDLGLKGYSKLNRSELIELLKPYEDKKITANYYISRR